MILICGWPSLPDSFPQSVNLLLVLILFFPSCTQIACLLISLKILFEIIFFEPNEKVSESIDLENIHLAKIGVILDMDNGLICFLNPDSNNAIVSFPKSQNGENRKR